jgi:hypothetical protein
MFYLNMCVPYLRGSWAQLGTPASLGGRLMANTGLPAGGCVPDALLGMVDTNLLRLFLPPPL